MNGLKREGMNGDRHEETRLTHWTNRPIKRRTELTPYTVRWEQRRTRLEDRF